MTIFHGIKVNSPQADALTITTVASGIIGMVCTSSDADVDTFPLNTLVLIDDVRGAIADAGVQGTLSRALSAIAAQCQPTVIVVRVAPGVAGNGVTVDEATDANVIAGLGLLLAAESQLGFRPRILGCPGLDSLDVVTALVPIAQTLRAFIYARAIADTVAEAVTYVEGFGARELMAIWPDLTGWPGQAVATALGLRAYIDETQGFAKSLSNVVFNGALGISEHVSWDLQDSSTDAGLLNAGRVTTIIRKDGFRFWGNHTTVELSSPFTFEVATRTDQILADTIADGCFPYVDQPITPHLVRFLEESINGEFTSLKNDPRGQQIIGASVSFDATKNPAAQLGAGKVQISYSYTPCAPLEDLELEQEITSSFYDDFSSQIA